MLWILMSSQRYLYESIVIYNRFNPCFVAGRYVGKLLCGKQSADLKLKLPEGVNGHLGGMLFTCDTPVKVFDYAELKDFLLTSVHGTNAEGHETGYVWNIKLVYFDIALADVHLYHAIG